MNNDPIANSLGLTPITPITQIPLAVPVAKTASDQQVEDDFEYARGNLIAAIEKGQEALTGILDVLVCHRILVAMRSLQHCSKQ